MMEYKRLTTEKQYGCGLCDDRKCKKPNLFCKDRLDCKIYNRLAELEDDLESGKIIRLPCEVDSEIYIIDYLTDNEDEKHYYIRKSKFHPKWIDEWRNMFCLTREEAEAKLKEFQE